MKKGLRLVVFVILLLLICPISVFAASSVPKAVMDATESVVRVGAEFKREYASGSGFVVGRDNENVYVVTNYHVVEGEPISVYIWTGKEETADAEIYAYSIQRDLCILKLDKGFLRDALVLSPIDEKGAAVYAVGFPGAADSLSDEEAHISSEATITDGIVSAVRKATIAENGDPVQLLQVTAAINSGNSGGPLFNSDGQVIGVNTYSIYDSQGVFGAIATDELIDFLEDNGIEPQLPAERTSMKNIVLGFAVIVVAISVLFVIISSVNRIKRQKSRTETRKDFDTREREKVSNRQRFFDEDYGYSADNPFVVSSVHMEGCYLAAFRTPEDEPFTWERQPRLLNTDVDSYKLYANGKFYREIFFNPNGYDSQKLPNGIELDEIVFGASKQGISVEQFLKNIAEQERLEKLKQKRKRTAKKTGVAVLLACALIIVGCFACLYGYPYLKYRIAGGKLDNGEYQQAIGMLENLKDYKDAPELLLKAKYEYACTLLDDGEYETAISSFSALGAYKDSQEQGQNAKYLFAEALFMAEDYEGAQILYQELGEYNNAVAQVTECEYQIALKEMENGQYGDAVYRLTVTIGKYEGKSKKIAECYFNLMLVAIEEGQWEEAYRYFNKIGGYDRDLDLTPYYYQVRTEYAKYAMLQSNLALVQTAVYILDNMNIGADSEEVSKLKIEANQKLIGLKYEEGKKKLNRKEYKSAIDFFETILDYKDSRELLHESMYQYVLENNPNDYQTSLIFRLVRKDVMIYLEKLMEAGYKDSESIYWEYKKLLQ